DRGLGRLPGGLEQALAERLTPEEGFRRCRAERRHSDGAERDARLAAADTVPLQGDDRGGRDRGVIVGRPRKELEKRRPARRRRWGHLDRGHQPGRRERGLVIVAEEFGQRQLAGSAGVPNLHRGPERQERDGGILIRVGMRQGTADRGHVADPDGGDPAKGFGRCGGGGSGCGSACAKAPPIVAMWRIRTVATRRKVSASTGSRSRTSGAISASRWVTSAPSRRPPLASIRPSPGTSRRLTRQRGWTRRCRIMVTRAVPPATTRASSPYSPKTASAS